MKINLNASKLDLSNMGLKEIPPEVFKCKNLKKLNLSNNLLVSLPKEIIQCKRLTNLNLSNNRIKSLFAKHFDLAYLEVLIINNNMLKSLPKQIENLKKLKKLSLSGNQISSLPVELGGLGTLLSLNVSGNRLESFPTEILQLSKLKTLWLSNNSFRSFPIQEIRAQLSQLKALYCFSSLSLNEQTLGSDYETLQKHKGNCIGKLNLLALKNKQEPVINSTHTDGSNTVGRATKHLFISYCHVDAEWLTKLNVYLKTMQYEGLEFDVWDDSRINAGEKWQEEIEQALNKADIAILIVSSHFLGSKFIRENEVPPLLKKAEQKGTAILPIIVQLCRFIKSPLAGYQSVNKPEKPLNALKEHEQDEVFYKLTEEVSRLLAS